MAELKQLADLVRYEVRQASPGPTQPISASWVVVLRDRTRHLRAKHVLGHRT